MTVRKNNLNKVAGEIKNLLGDIEGIQIKQVNNRVVIDGEILLPRDMNRIYSVVSQFGDVASSMVTMSPLAQKKIAELIEKASRFAARLNPVLHRELGDLVRSMNCYYSNLIEGHNTTPREITGAPRNFFTPAMRTVTRSSTAVSRRRT